jgi:uncharacterized protein with HEPN domain
MSFEPREYLRHILAEANYLLEPSRDVSKTEFLRSETLRRAFVKSLEIIGEASTKPSPMPAGAPTRSTRSSSSGARRERRW